MFLSFSLFAGLLAFLYACDWIFSLAAGSGARKYRRKNRGRMDNRLPGGPNYPLWSSESGKRPGRRPDVSRRRSAQKFFS